MLMSLMTCENEYKTEIGNYNSEENEKEGSVEDEEKEVEEEWEKIKLRLNGVENGNQTGTEK